MDFDITDVVLFDTKYLLHFYTYSCRPFILLVSMLLGWNDFRFCFWLIGFLENEALEFAYMSVYILKVETSYSWVKKRWCRYYTQLLGHMWIMLGTYVNILCNWLILWQNALYLQLGRFMMCLMLQRIRFQVQVLKSCKSIQETSEEVLDFKAQ